MESKSQMISVIVLPVETIKPLWLDDLLWDLLKMETNKEAPLSLRTIGAFTVSGSELFKMKQN